MQDLVNTADLEDGTDELRSPAGLRQWMRERGMAGEGLDAAGLEEALALREALRAVCLAHAGTDVPAVTLERLAGLLERGPLTLDVDAAGSVRIRPRAGLTGAGELIARAAAAIAAATADGSWPRLKACASESCRWVYYDRSPAGRSRWCTMAVCGSRAKMRTYRRSKAAGTAERPGDQADGRPMAR